MVQEKPLIQGQKFGNLTVIRRVAPSEIPEKSVRIVYYLFKCDCGKTKIINKYSALRGTSKSCGCGQSHRSSHPTQNLVGKKYGMLTVTAFHEMSRFTNGGFPRKQGISSWDCICECGNTANVLGINLKNAKTISCGCLEKKKQEEFVAMVTTHGKSGTKFYKFYMGFKNLCKMAREVNPFSGFEQFAERFEEAYSKLKRPTIERISNDLPLTVDNLRVTEREWKVNRINLDPRKNDARVTIGGFTQNLTQWGALLGLTRERARQLHNAGRLEERVSTAIQAFNTLKKDSLDGTAPQGQT